MSSSKIKVTIDSGRKISTSGDMFQSGGGGGGGQPKKKSVFDRLGHTSSKSVVSLINFFSLQQHFKGGSCKEQIK